MLVSGCCIVYKLSIIITFYHASSKWCLTRGARAREMVSEMHFSPSYSCNKAETMLSTDADVWPTSTLCKLSRVGGMYNWVRHDLRFTRYSRARHSILWYRPCGSYAQNLSYNTMLFTSDSTLTDCKELLAIMIIHSTAVVVPAVRLYNICTGKVQTNCSQWSW